MELFDAEIIATEVQTSTFFHKIQWSG